MFTTLISQAELAANLGAPSWVIVDCRFALGDTAAGQRAYHAGHIPGAVYAHLDDDLSGPPVTDAGRHPLPTPDAIVALARRLGISNNTQVVAYDDRPGNMVSARLWWMLRYLGHEAVAVLDGGWAAWEAANGPTVAGAEQNQPGTFDGAPNPAMLVTLAQVPLLTHLIDSRAPNGIAVKSNRWTNGAGHIPGASNYDFTNNLQADGRFLPVAELQSQRESLLGKTSPDEATFYCGSGVSACVNLLAVAHSGMPMPRLYVGSWSEWSSDPQRPAATGDAPA